MEIGGVLEHYKTDRRCAELVEALNDPTNPVISLAGLRGSQSAFILAAAFTAEARPMLIVLDNKEQAAYFRNDLVNILERKDVYSFPDSFKKPGRFEETNKTNLLQRAETVSKLTHSITRGEIVVTYPEALFEKVINTKSLIENTIKIKAGEKLDTDFVIDLLVECGFEAVDFVYEPGQYTLRGGIIDVFSFGNELPYRLELFDDEVESIRIFDPLTQLSTRKVSQIVIVPNIQTQFKSSDKTSLLNLLPDEAVIFLNSEATLLARLEDCEKKASEMLKNLDDLDLDEEHPLFEAGMGSFVDAKEMRLQLEERKLVHFGNELVKADFAFEFKAEEQPSFNKNFHLLIEHLQENTKKGYQNCLLTDSPRQVNRFNYIFSDMGVEVHFEPVMTSIGEGFIDHDLKLVCYTDHQFFGRYYKYKVKKAYSKDKALTVKLLRELRPGDYVTHIDHGVGVYSGLETIEVTGKKQESVRIKYKDGDLLYVNINSLHKISKYVGKEGRPPRVNKLGSDAWERVKRKTKGKIKDIAKDLIKLYAKRKATEGFGFSPDTYLQTELEASFIYEDTPDQLKATQKVKEDMEAQAPMDRLVCGDVGFGKTEIAIRAAAKAVADSKQVAVLVPTTILVLQHYKTFKTRLKDFPCKVEFINRFKTSKQKKEIVDALKTGEIDIVIGTHALTSKTISFKNLGLLIIDEEQKFGVGVKEKLRNLKVNVDTLTLTATPIPRTLQFSLMSARDLSTISTAPPNRQPVTTELMRFNGEKIRDAILYEVYRGGQVFFVHNRVRDIEDVAAMVRKYCPDIDIGIAHGQMDNKTLEDIMVGFEKRRYDVLISTNIIESGLDIPNANTIIINNAHWFGLSDLHQLRGRVGRSNKKAFAYLITPPLHSLPDDARKRLKTIEQFADLGSGFNIAMRDLDIRGAGNLLGAEQSGFIADIGFETYQKILNEAIQELKQNEFKEVFQDQLIEESKFVTDCQIDTDLEMLIPDHYVNQVNERFNLYVELNKVETEEALQKFAAQLRDRFGALPKEVKELFNGLRLRWVAISLGFERLVIKSRKLRCYFVENQESVYYKSALFSNLLALIQSKKNCVIKQSAKHLILIFEGVHNMKQATRLLQELATELGLEAREKTGVEVLNG